MTLCTQFTDGTAAQGEMHAGFNGKGVIAKGKGFQGCLKFQRIGSVVGNGEEPLGDEFTYALGGEFAETGQGEAVVGAVEGVFEKFEDGLTEITIVPEGREKEEVDSV